MPASLVTVENKTANGDINTYTIPYACSVTIRGRTTDVLVYDADEINYFTISSGSALTINTHNMKGDTLHLKADNGAVIELIYQARR